MRSVQGKQLTSYDRGVLAERVVTADRVVVDVGTGDARTAYRLAKAHPDWLVVGVDPAWQRMVPTATRAGRKPAKGGTPNLLLVCASAEDPPEELHGVADEVLTLMPWGKLLRGVVLGEPDVCGGLRRIAHAGAPLEVTVGTSIWRDPVPLEIHDLPELTVAYVDSVLSGRLAAAGWRVEHAEVLAGDQSPPRSSSWAKRLGSSTVEAVMHLRATAV